MAPMWDNNTWTSTEISRSDIWRLLENTFIYSGTNKWQNREWEHLTKTLHAEKNVKT